MLDITSQVNGIIKKAKVKEGICHIFTTHATAAIIINENYDPEICVDVHDALAKLFPQGKWRHDRIDGNADSHIKAALCGPSETIPISNEKLYLGTWQSVMLAEFDGPRSRTIIITIQKTKNN